MAKESKSIMFLWTGKDRSGKQVKGELAAQNETLVKAMLRRQGVVQAKVKKKPKPLFGGSKKITPKDIAIFSRQLATMMSSGVPLVQAFEIVGRGHENAGMQDLILSIKADVEKGDSLTDALNKHPLYFNALYCNLIQAGEQAGILEGILEKISTYLEKTEGLKSKIKSALFYPAAVIVVAMIVISILLIFVIPQFEDLFKGFGASLPALTQLVINLSAFFQEQILLIIITIVSIVVGFVQLKKRSKKFGFLLDRMALKLPIFGPIFNKASIARFSRTLETMFAAGTPLVEAMDSVAGACGNIVFYRATMQIKERVSTGISLADAMQGAQLFPNMVLQMVAIGEESGAIDTMLGKVADWYEQEVDDAVDALTSLLEPMIMVFIGGTVGVVIVAMYLPIFKLGSAI